MACCACPTSSPIPAAAHQAAPVALTGGQCRSLLADLAHLADPCHRRGRRHPLAGVLAVAACAVLACASDGITDNDIDLAKHVEGLV